MIEVWAPRAAKVEIEWSTGDGEPRRDPMMATTDGWWRWEGEPTAYENGVGDKGGTGADHGDLDYAFVVDGAEPALPDPRSAWQPHGVHGPSRFYDAARFPWTDRDWRGTRSGAGMLGGLVYELHVGTFTPEGTFEAAITHLDHLVELGVDLVEVMPVAPFPGDWGWGYDGVALFAVHDRYGGPEGLQRFVDACHRVGLGVCLDVVHNHLGPSGNYLSRFGPYFTDRHHTPWGEAVNLDAPDNAPVRAFLLESALRWLRDFHVDALRLDAVHELKDDSEKHFLAELSDSVRALADELGRPLDLIAESDLNDVTMVAPTSLGGRGMTAQWDDDVHHALHVALTGEAHGYYADFAGRSPAHPDGGPLGVLKKVFEQGFLHDGRWSSFRDSEWGVPIDRETFDARRLLAYLQTHDQVGNRAAGDRLGAGLTAGQQAIGAALVLLGPMTPMVFMGEEWGASTPFAFFTSFEDGLLAEAVSEGRRTEFASHGWDPDTVPDPQAVTTREASVLPWSEVDEGEHARLLRWYAVLSALRRDRLGDRETRLADVTVDVDEDARWVVMRHCPAGSTAYAVVANLGDAEATVPLDVSTAATVLADFAGAHLKAEGVALPPHGVAIVQLSPAGAP